jgi:hypothetical protein
MGIEEIHISGSEKSLSDKDLRQLVIDEINKHKKVLKFNLPEPTPEQMKGPHHVRLDRFLMLFNVNPHAKRVITDPTLVSSFKVEVKTGPELRVKQMVRSSRTNNGSYAYNASSFAPVVPAPWSASEPMDEDVHNSDDDDE